MQKQQETIPENEKYLKVETLCKSLSGVEVPMLTVTSNVLSTTQYTQPLKEDFLSELLESETKDWDQMRVRMLKKEVIARFKKQHKKVLMITARIHPGEACGSHVMEGFLKFICSSDPKAIELRGKLIIKIIPMINVDGVIIGNYRCCISGHDLNRQFADPDPKLHPIICAIKATLDGFIDKGIEISGYIDLHGHSAKKCVFAYGPYYPIHMDHYVRVRILPKLLSGQTQMFRYSACRFKRENSKLNAARLVISKEFGVVNSLTLESSFYGFLNEERKVFEFCSKFYEKMGEHLMRALYQYERLATEEKLIKLKILIKNKRKKRVLQRTKRSQVPKDDKKAITFRRKENKSESEQNTIVKGIIRLEECYDNKFVDKTVEHKCKIREIIRIIKEECETERIDSDSDSDSNSDSSLSEEEKEVLTIKKTLPSTDVGAIKVKIEPQKLSESFNRKKLITIDKQGLISNDNKVGYILPQAKKHALHLKSNFRRSR